MNVIHKSTRYPNVNATFFDIKYECIFVFHSEGG